MGQKISLKYAVWIWFLAALFFLYEFFLRAFPNTLHSQLVETFSLSSTQFAMIGGIYYLAYSLLQIPAGYIFDRLGSKLTLTLACLICSFGILIFIISNLYTISLIGRLLMGIGSSFGFIGLLTISVKYFDHKYLGFLSGATQILGAMGPILAATPLLLLVQTLHYWQYALVIVTIFGFILSLLLWFNIPKHKIQPKKTEKKKSENFLKLLIKSPTQWLVSLYAFFNYATIPTLGAVWGVNFLEKKGLVQTNAATIISFLWIGLAVGSPIMGAISDKFKNRLNALWIVSIFGFILTLLLILPIHYSHTTYGILFFLISCAASGQTLSFTVLGEKMKEHLHAVSFGINNTFVMISGFIIPLTVGILIQKFSLSETVSLSILPICFLISFIISIIIFISAKNNYI